MNSLDLYASIEEFLPFEDEVNFLYNIFLDIIKEIEPNTLIDIGCGQGNFCKLVQKEDIKAFGVDLSQKQIQIALEKGIEAKAIDIKDIDTTYDCATAIFDVVNYIPKNELETFFQNGYNLLNNNGYFI